MKKIFLLFLLNLLSSNQLNIESSYITYTGIHPLHTWEGTSKEFICNIKEEKNGYYTSYDIIDDSVIPSQGFDEKNVFDEKTVDFNKRHSEMISKLALKEKFFLFLHYTEMHKHLVNAVIQKALF